ncbi:glycosyltransferase family 2 protein [Candidatus Amarolinea aalborgensis]|uniref:glycosyltransferase family 2 protein n=1 Tax=Candidatus Amarolinea aalborgensis TaxID=2249329 RepID=UPI003BF9A790
MPDAGAALPPIAATDALAVSVVVPLYNEEESIPALQTQLTAALAALNRPFEIIVVDDGSRDNSFALLRAWQAQDPAHVRVVRFRRNFGQTAAFAAGFSRARGAVIVTIDADLQNDPADIGLLLAKIAEGYDVVSGWRVQRQDAALSRRLPSHIANALISRVTGVALHDYGCSLKAYRREVLQNVKLYGELHRFIPAIASWMGTEVAEIPVNHRARQFGRSKYNLSRTFRVILDLITVRFLLGYATRPLHVFGGIGLAMGALGTAIGFYLTYLKLVLGQSIGSRPLLLLAVLLVMLGVQMMSIGLLGEMTMRTYYETQDKPIFVIREVLENHATEQEAKQAP